MAAAPLNTVKLVDEFGFEIGPRPDSAVDTDGSSDPGYDLVSYGSPEEESPRVPHYRMRNKSRRD